MTTPAPPLSLAAQAVWDAWNDAYEAQGPLEDMGYPLAAALITAADQPYEVPAQYRGEDYWMYRRGVEAERRQLLALATELRQAAMTEGFAILSWSEERQPCEECRYNHCIAETPFGRFLISWKGWKEHPAVTAVTADETPFGGWFECWNSVEEAKSGCQSEYNRRLALVSLPQLQPEPRPAVADLSPAAQAVRRDLAQIMAELHQRCRISISPTDVLPIILETNDAALQAGINSLCAAALRAAADQVVPAETEPCNAFEEEGYVPGRLREQRQATRHQFLTIATELEAH